jgi:hypothetical protein
MPHCPACASTVKFDATQCESCGAPFDSPRLALLESRLTAQQESLVQIPRSVSIALGILGIGGGAAGLLAILSNAVSQPFKVSTFLIYLLASGVYGLGVWSGVVAIQRRYGWVRQNIFFWGAQVPVVGSYILSYSLAAGGFLNLWIKPFEVRAGFDFLIGSKFNLHLFLPGDFLLGVNVFALVITVYLIKAQREVKTESS